MLQDNAQPTAATPGYGKIRLFARLQLTAPIAVAAFTR